MSCGKGCRESAERERRVFVFARFGTVSLKNIPQTFCTYTFYTLEEIRPKTQLVRLSRTVSREPSFWALAKYLLVVQ